MADEQPMDFGSAIKQKITESVQNMDVVSILQRIVASTPEDEESEEIRGKLQGVLSQFNEMSDVEKEQFTAQMRNLLASKVATRLSDHEIKLDGIKEAIGEAIVYRLAIVGVGALLLVILIVFFGYKLYKSLKEKETKREEKKKAKQLKKKK